jgi:hypothetical protein
MCRMCDEGWALDMVLRVFRKQIQHQGWGVVHEAPAGAAAGFSYTVGLTRLHGHPEVLVSGQPPEAATLLLNVVAAAVRGGLWVEAGLLFPADDGGQVQFAQVHAPERLRHSQEIYAGPIGRVPALQAIWTDYEGHWPWSPGWPGTAADQPLFGDPIHT